jgi:lysophospholipase L1-like esterase
MGFTVHRYDTGLWAGDSLTQLGWFSVAGGMVDQINTQIGTTSVADQRASIPSGGFSTVGGVAAKIKGGAVSVINRGVSGWSSTEIFADKASVVALRPSFIVLDIGINDATLGTAPATFRSNLDGTLDAYQAGLPGVQILGVLPMVCGELWTHVGPAFSGNGFDPAIDAIIAQAAASYTAHSVPFVPLRPAALSYIIANGPAEPGASFGTLVDSSQKHPLVPAGQLWMCNQVMPYVTVVP